MKFTQKQHDINKKDDRQETPMDALVNNINLERDMVIMVICLPMWFLWYPECPILSEGTANTAVEELPFFYW